MDSKQKKTSVRDLIAFWIFGLANNYAYVIMLSAAADIIAQQESPSSHVNEVFAHNVTVDKCEEKITTKACNHLPTGAVLLADILPALIVKLSCPFFMHRIPFGFRHFLVCALQTISYLVVAFSNNIYLSLAGVTFASFGSGLGEICYLALASHYSKSTISTWSSGTGGAGIFGALVYAVSCLYVRAWLFVREANLSKILDTHRTEAGGPESQDGSSLHAVVPILFAITYWFVLTPSPTVHRMSLFDVKTWLVPPRSSSTSRASMFSPSTVSEAERSYGESLPEKSATPSGDVTLGSASFSNRSSEEEKGIISHTFAGKLRIAVPLLRYMIPLALVYFSEYLINQGIAETIYFDCSHGFSLAKASQYRWVPRSSVNVIELSVCALYALPVLQMINAIVFFFDAIYGFIPHIGILFAMILVEGLFGGASYVNTFNLIHKKALPELKEFSLSIASLSDTIGILGAAISSMPIHSYICSSSR